MVGQKETVSSAPRSVASKCPISAHLHTWAVATRETRLQRGRRSGEAAVDTAVRTLRDERIGLEVSQRFLAGQLGCSQSEYSRLESGAQPETVRLVRLAEVAALLGLELSLGLHPAGHPIRDKGQLALIRRFRAELPAAFDVRAEVPFPAPGDPRVWDLVLRLDDVLIGVEAETRVRDMQALVRRMRGRERDGGVDVVLLVLSDSRLNRRLVGELRTALGEGWESSQRRVFGALRTGQVAPGSGVQLV